MNQPKVPFFAERICSFAFVFGFGSLVALVARVNGANLLVQWIACLGVTGLLYYLMGSAMTPYERFGHVVMEDARRMVAKFGTKPYPFGWLWVSTACAVALCILFVAVVPSIFAYLAVLAAVAQEFFKVKLTWGFMHGVGPGNAAALAMSSLRSEDGDD